MSIVIVPLIFAAVSLVFAVIVLDQFLARRKSYQLIGYGTCSGLC